MQSTITIIQYLNPFSKDPVIIVSAASQEASNGVVKYWKMQSTIKIIQYCNRAETPESSHGIVKCLNTKGYWE